MGSIVSFWRKIWREENFAENIYKSTLRTVFSFDALSVYLNTEGSNEKAFLSGRLTKTHTCA